MIFEIILSVVIVIQTYVVINLMIKTEKLETFIENFENQLTQSIEENVSDASDQIQSVAENTGINQAVRNVGANTTNQLKGIQAVNPNTNVGKIDVTSPGTGAALGLSPIDQAIAARRGSPLTVPKEQYGSLFNQ